MAKAKKVEKRSAPKKAARKVVKPVPKTEPGDYGKMARMILDDKPKKTKSPTLVKPSYPERVPDKPPEPEAPKMEVSVRNIYHEAQYMPALCFRKPGAMHVPCVVGDPIGGIRKFTIPAVHHDKSTVLQHGFGAFAGPYSPERFASHMRRLASSAAITPEARALLLPYAPDMPTGPAVASPDRETLGGTGIDSPDAAERATRKLYGARKAASGPNRTSGKELIRTLATVAKLPPEKVRAKLRAAGLRAPYTDETACRKALGVNA
jgi:hypothetical protein